MKLVVMKFGGSSVADSGKIKNVANRVIANKKKGYRVVSPVPELFSIHPPLVRMVNMY